MKMMKKIFAIILMIVMLPINNIIAFAQEANSGSFFGWNWLTGELNGTIGLDYETKHSGNASVKMSCKSARQSGKYLWLYTPVTVQAGKTYEFGMWTKSKKTELVYCIVEWISESSHELLPIGASNDWIESKFEWTPTVTQDARLMFILEGASNGFWIDDVYFREKGTENNLISNGTFETGVESVANVETLYNEVIENGSFTTEQLKQLGGVLGYIQTRKQEGIKLDGDNSDWSNYDAIYMPVMQKQIQTFMSDDKDKDVTAEVKTAYDDESLYIMFDVTDDVFYPITKDRTDYNYWDGDSIQFAVSPVEEDLKEKDPNEPENPDDVAGYDFGIGTGGVDTSNSVKFGKEISIVCDPNSIDAEVHSSYLTDEEKAKVVAKAKNSGEHTIYEVQIPWETIIEGGKPKEKLLFNFLVNDNDGNGRRYCVELTDGISRSKDNTNFPFLELVDDDSDFFSWIVLNRDSGIYGGYDLYIVNAADKERTFKINNRYTQEEKEVSIAAQSGIKIWHDFSAIGEFQIICDVTCDGKTVQAKSRTFKSDSKYFSPDDAAGVKENAEKMAAEIKTLLDQCEEKGIHTDYETANYMILSRFVDYIQEDINNGYYKTMQYMDDSLKKIYEETKKDLNAYLSGEKMPFEVPRYITSDKRVEIEGGHFVADTNTNGVVEKRPVFLTGWGHFISSSNDLKNFPAFGFNIIQYGAYPRDILLPAGSGTAIPGESDYSINPNWVMRWLPDILKKGEESNMTVDVLFGPHVFPQFVYDKYPDTITGSPEFIKYNIMDERMKKVIKLSLEALIPQIKDYKSLSSICISNEPIFRTALSDEFYRPYWAGFLEKRYNGDLARLNDNYGTAYTSFTEVEFPEINKDGNTLSIDDARDYDYCDFNAEIMSSWHQFICDTIREMAPDIPLQAKMHLTPRSSDWHPSMRNVVDSGVKYQYYKDMFDINGNDGGHYLTNDWHMRELDYYYQIDYQKTFKKAPVANTEDHILQDSITPFESIYSDYAAQQIWQGAVHGKGMSVIWVWEWEYSPQSALYGSLMRRPDGISKISKISLDLQRLSNEVVALQDDEPEVALLYSDASRNYSNTYTVGCYAAYESLRYAGKSVQFIAETGVDVARKLENCKVLIIPKTVQVKEDLPEKIADFVRNGGKVLVCDRDTFTKNEYDKPLTGKAKESADYIKANATLIENMDQSTDTLGEMSFEDFHKYIKDYLKNNNMQYVRVVDAETGEDVDYVEINTGICNDKLILNMNSLRGDKKVKIIADNQTITSSYDLRSGDNFGEVIELTKYEPVMLEINVSNQFIDTYNHWAENNISNLTNKGIIKGISNSRFAPDKQISIAEILALLARSYGLDCSSSEDDLKWYDGTIRALNNAGMDISEIRDFDKKATREDAAEWAVKFYEKFMAAINSGMANQYTDYSQINDKEAVDKATVAGIMSGYPDGSFGGSKGITRAEFATVLVNLLKK